MGPQDVRIRCTYGTVYDGGGAENEVILTALFFNRDGSITDGDAFAAWATKACAKYEALLALNAELVAALETMVKCDGCEGGGAHTDEARDVLAKCSKVEI